MNQLYDCLANSLIVYFSRRGENYVNGSVKKLAVGNTEVVAGILQHITKARSFKLEPVKKYSSNYYVCIDEAKQDLHKNIRPELAAWPDALEDYQTIFLGYPNYWGTMPMAVFSFLEHYDFTGKHILPFCTHEDGGMGKSVSDLKRLCPTATIYTGFAVRGIQVRQCCDDLENWVQSCLELNKIER